MIIINRGVSYIYSIMVYKNILFLYRWNIKNVKDYYIFGYWNYYIYICGDKVITYKD